MMTSKRQKRTKVWWEDAHGVAEHTSTDTHTQGAAIPPVE